MSQDSQDSQDLPSLRDAREGSDPEPDFPALEMFDSNSFSQDVVHDQPSSAKKHKNLSLPNGTSNKKRKKLSSSDSTGKKKHKSRGVALDSSTAKEQNQPEIPDARPVPQSDWRRSSDDAASHINAGAENVEGDYEHVAQQASQENAIHQSGEMTEELLQAQAQAQAEAPTEEQHQTPADGATSTPRRARSTRKKSKPTYFEQPAADVPPKDLPSPPRRTKKAKRQKKVARRSHHNDEVHHDDNGVRPTYTTGQFTAFELSRIAAAIEHFRAEYNMAQHEVNEMIQARGGTAAGELHAQLWDRVFAECPDRHRQKIINTARKKFHNYVARGTWTAEQDQELTTLVNQVGKKWSEIGALINRHSEDVRDRYRNYIVCGDAQKKQSWDPEEEENLTLYVHQALATVARMRIEEPERLDPHKTDEEHIDWQYMSERMKRTRSRLQCMTKWKALKSRTDSKDKPASAESDSSIAFRLDKARRQLEDMPDTEKYRLVLAIKSMLASSTAKIPWQKLCDKQFRSLWHRATQELVWSRLLKSVPGSDMRPVRDCAQYLVDEYDQNGELPSIAGEGWDDEEEMALISQVPLGRKESRPSTSSERLTLEDMEDDDPDQEGMEGGNAHQEDREEEEEAHLATETQELIDPALNTLSQVPQSAQKATPAKRSQKGKRPSTKKSKKRARPIEESADIPADAEEAASD